MSGCNDFILPVKIVLWKTEVWYLNIKSSNFWWSKSKSLSLKSNS